jgi:hypothetical protein
MLSAGAARVNGDREHRVIVFAVDPVKLVAPHLLDMLGNRRFESISLQRQVSCEPVFLRLGARGIRSTAPWRAACPPCRRLAVTAGRASMAVLWLFAATAASGQTNPGANDRVAVVQAICRQYAAAQRVLPYDTMYAQCMYARGYRVPGFSPSPDSPGYQGDYRARRLTWWRLMTDPPF